MDESWTAALVVLMVGLGIVTVWWHFSRSRAMVKQWAAECGYQLIGCEFRWLRRGSFFWTTSKNQAVYYVTVIDSDGQRRNGYVRCGSWWTGLLSDKVEVRWEDE